MIIKPQRRTKLILSLLLIDLFFVISIRHSFTFISSTDETHGIAQAAEPLCSNSSSTTWAMRYNAGGYTREGGSVIWTSDGRIVVAGGLGPNYWLANIETDGTPIWQRYYLGSEIDYPYSVTQTQDDGYVFAGYSSSYAISGQDIWILKLDSTGNVLWQKSYGEFGSDQAKSIIQLSNGGYAVAGYRRLSGDEDAMILRLDPFGNLIWNRKFGGEDPDPANTVLETPEGDLILAGRTESLAPNYASAWVIKLDDNGSVDWQKWYGRSFSEIKSAANASDDGYLLAGSTIGQYGWLLKLDIDGNLLWEKKYQTEGLNSEIEEVKATVDGGYIAVGTLWPSSPSYLGDIWLLKVDRDGDVEWSKKYDVGQEDFGYSVDTVAGGGYVVSGSSRDEAGRYAVLLRLNEEGNIPDCNIVINNPITAAPDNVSEAGTSVTDDIYQLTVQNSNSSPRTTGLWPVPLCGEVPERFGINYRLGAPGSYFTLAGRAFAGEWVNVLVNGVNLGSVAPGSSGDISFLLLTSAADEGAYVVRVDAANASEMTAFRLDSQQPMRPQEGNGPIFDVPAGISLSRINWLPAIRSN